MKNKWIAALALAGLLLTTGAYAESTPSETGAPVQAEAQQKAHAHAQFIREEAAGKQRKAKPEQHERADQQHARPAEQSLADAEITGNGARYGAQAGRAGQVWIAQNANQAHPSFSK